VNFYFGDIIVTSFINVRYCNVAVEGIPQGTAFCYLYSVGKGLVQMPSEMRPVYRQVFYETSNKCLV